ncbi:MAG: mechanosensitive ion channel family protein [Bacteroidota bacterium]
MNQNRAFTGFFILMLLCVSLKTLAQEKEEKEVFFNLSSPYHTIVTHLINLQPETYNPDYSARTIGGNLEIQKRQEIAIKIKRIFDGEGIYIDPEIIPRNENYNDSSGNVIRHRYVITSKLPDLYLEKVGNEWLYSEYSVRKVYEIYRNIYPFGTDKLMNILPKAGGSQVMGLYVWQLFGMLILILTSVILFKLLNFVFERFIVRILKKLGYHNTAKNFVVAVAKPISTMSIIFLLIVFTPVLQLPIQVAKYVVLILRGLWPLFLTLVFYKLIDLISIYFERLASKTETTLDDQLVPLLRKALKAFVIIVGVLFILNNLDFNIWPLLTGLSIGGLAFALAAQDTIKNFFGSLMIFIDKPFQIGDWITSSDIDGTVEEVGFRSTRIRTFRNSVTSVPNGKLADLTIDNHGLRIYRRFFTQIAITYDTPAERIELFVQGLRRIVENHEFTRKDYYEVHLNELANSSLNVMFYIFFKVPSWSDELRCRHEIIIEIIKLAELLSIRFAFPTQTLHMETFPDKMSLTPHLKPVDSDLKARLDSFFKKPKP